MKMRVSEIWGTITGGLWFFPLMMVISSALLAIITLWLDAEFSIDWGTGLGLVYASSLDGGRELLSTIAGSMMTVTGVVFSITIVTLSLTSNQYGPRLLRNFLKDRGTQIVLGTFLATFTYSLIILRTLQDTGDENDVPEISITVGAVLALVSLGVLIYFIHHITQSIQASSIFSDVGREIGKTVDQLFPERIGQSGKAAAQPGKTSGEPDLDHPHQIIRSETAGYVRAIDANALMNAAVENNAILRMTVRPGSYVYKNGPVAQAWVATGNQTELASGVTGSIVTGRSRTPFQDIDFLLSQLVQAALLALSTGVNNSLVAVEAIDWIGSSLAHIAERELPSTHRYDDDGDLRIIAPTATFESLLNNSFDPLRESSQGNTLVTAHLMETIIRLAPHIHRDSDREALANQARLLEMSGREAATNDHDRRRVVALYTIAVQAFHSPSVAESDR
jgi:uncharacterized membrane protein